MSKEQRKTRRSEGAYRLWSVTERERSISKLFFIKIWDCVEIEPKTKAKRRLFKMAELKIGFIQKYYQKRANGELDIVRNAQEVYEEKLQDWLKKLTEAQSKYDESVVLFDGMKSTPIKKTDHATIAKINSAKSEISKNGQKLANAKMEYDQLVGLCNLLDRFFSSVEIFYTNGEYRFLVKLIPEKKFNSLLRSTNDVISLSELVAKLQDKIVVKANTIGGALKKAIDNIDITVRVVSEDVLSDATSTLEADGFTFVDDVKEEVDIDLAQAPNTSTNVNPA